MTTKPKPTTKKPRPDEFALLEKLMLRHGYRLFSESGARRYETLTNLRTMKSRAAIAVRLVVPIDTAYGKEMDRAYRAADRAKARKAKRAARRTP